MSYKFQKIIDQWVDENRRYSLKNCVQYKEYINLSGYELFSF